MIHIKPQYHPLALSALQKLAEQDIVCAPDEILWLHQEALKASRLAPSDSDMLDFPVLCGNAALWPLSLGARDWLDRYAFPWFADSERMRALCIAFAMAHSRKPEIFFCLTSRARTFWRVCYWAGALSCTFRELSACIDRMLGLDGELVEILNPKEAEARKSNQALPAPAAGFGSAIALLCHFYGETPEHWLWKESEERITELLDNISKILPDQSKSVSKSDFIALSKFRLVVEHIREARLAEKETTENEG